MTENKESHVPLTVTPQTEEEHAQRMRDDQGFYNGGATEQPLSKPSFSPPTFEEYLKRSHDPLIQRDRDRQGPRRKRRP